MDTNGPEGLIEGAVEDPLAAARALIAEEQRTRMEACAAEVQQVLAKHGMRLEVPPAQISLVPDL